MQDVHSIAALRLTLQYTKSSTMPSDHKVLLMSLLTEALHDRQEQDANAAARESSSRPWQEADTEELQTFLNGKIATSWQHADELLVLLASKLGREPRYVRSKATDLGFGAGVDFRVARAVMVERARTDIERGASSNG